MTVTKPTWISQLEVRGWAIVPGAVPRERAEGYAADALQWLENFPLGFDRHDKSTWTKANLPDNWKNGVFNFYGVAHERFTWEIRQEAGIVNAFSQLWGTEDLIVSFDGINISLPVGENGRTDVQPTGKWPHMDQSVTRPGFQLAQGIFVATDSGPNDGGLVVLEGTHKLAPALFEATGGWKVEQERGADVNSYQYTDADCKWFLAQPGVKEFKVEASAGDLIIWDSRTVHWNRTPVAGKTRVATYVCYCPKDYADSKTLLRKTQIFEERKATTHWPQLNVVPEDNLGGPKRGGGIDPHRRAQPFAEPILTAIGRRLAGFED